MAFEGRECQFKLLKKNHNRRSVKLKKLVGTYWKSVKCRILLKEIGANLQHKNVI